ncbi:MAG: ATP-grasp domain-containing protein [Gammaproteobacteria bacterium]|nr:MAG: ATP-grasp domain-containing protein [Gammaproteobacteria bacterium]UTW42668.1 ATP-grasp domain-containing protein [bacterium SCSIO 12844]
MKKKEVIIIIDGFSTGEDLVKVISSLVKIEFIHIITPSCSYNLKQKLIDIHVNKDEFIDELVYDNNFQCLMEKLSKYDIKNVVCGLEGQGVTLAEEILESLGMNKNNYTKLQSRRNKHEMNLELKRAGLSTIREKIILKDTSIDQAINEIGNKYPMVLKPINSGGSDGFHLCISEPEVYNSAEILFNKKNTFGEENTSLLLQEYLSGKEYCINTVSNGEFRVVTDIWCYDNFFTDDGRRLCYSSTLVDHKKKQDLIDYTYQCLDALGCYYGACHTELMQQNDRIVMIESANRLMGGIPSILLRECLSTTQLDAFCQMIVDPKCLLDLSIGIKKFIKIVNIIHDEKPGNLVSIEKLDLFKSLKSFRNLKINVSIGQKIETTSSIHNCIGHVLLTHESLTQLDLDECYIRQNQSQIFKIV